MKKSHIAKLDKLWSEKVKTNSKYACECCLEEGIRMEAAHIRGRRKRNTRWGCFIDGVYDLCGMCLCSNCHREYDEHTKKEDFIRRVVIGEERYLKIQQASEVIAKNQDFATIKNELK